MSLDNNTTGLNEILNMAKNLPNAGEGGEAVQEIVYVDCSFDMKTGTVTVTNYTLEELFALVSEIPKKYFILNFADMFYLPMCIANDEGIAFSMSYPENDSSTSSLAVIIERDGTSEVLSSGNLSSITAPKVAYVDGEVDMTTFTFTSIEKTYAEIETLVESGAYVVLRGKFAYVSGSEPVDTIYLPLAGHIKEQGIIYFDGTAQTTLGDSLIIIHIAVNVYSKYGIETIVRIVSATDLRDLFNPQA